MCWHLAIGLNLAIVKSIISIIMPMIETIVMIMMQILTVANSWNSISSCLFSAVIVARKVNLTSTFFQIKKSVWTLFLGVVYPPSLAKINWRVFVSPY